MGQINDFIELLHTDKALSMAFEKDPVDICNQLNIPLSEKACLIVRNMMLEKRKPRYVKYLFSELCNEVSPYNDKLFSAYEGILMSQYADCLLASENDRNKLRVEKELRATPIFTLLPALLGNECLSREMLVRVTRFFSAMCDACLNIDRLADGDYTLSTTAYMDTLIRINHLQIQLSDMQQELHINVYAQWTQRFADFIKGIEIENAMSRGNLNKVISKEFHEELSYYKHAVLFFAIDIIAALTKRENSTIDKCFRNYFNGVQLLDDLKDLEEDSQAKRSTFALTVLSGLDQEQMNGVFHQLQIEATKYMQQASNYCPAIYHRLKEHFECISHITSNKLE